MEIVAHRTILICHRLMNEPVLEEGLMAVLGVGRRGQKQHRQGDKQAPEVKSRATHPGRFITVFLRCQQVMCCRSRPRSCNPERRTQNAERRIQPQTLGAYAPQVSSFRFQVENQTPNHAPYALLYTLHARSPGSSGSTFKVPCSRFYKAPTFAEASAGKRITDYGLRPLTIGRWSLDVLYPSTPCTLHSALIY